MKNTNILLWLIAVAALILSVVNTVNRVQPRSSSAAYSYASKEQIMVDILRCDPADIIVVCHWKLGNHNEMKSITYYVDGKLFTQLPVQYIEPGFSNFQAGMPTQLSAGRHLFRVDAVDVRGNKASDEMYFQF